MAATKPRDVTLLSDRELLHRFARTNDEAAFRQLVDRHAPLVLGACRRGLHCAADADDAFQATFVVLARSAGKIRNREALGSWLYGVATRVCLRMRRDAKRRSTQELMDPLAELVDPLDELLARHDEMVADEELNALPNSLRAPIVLRYLAGQSNADVAKQLGITIAALEGRLKRGKQQLRMRLLRRGVTMGAVVATLKATRVVASEVPHQLTASTVDLAISGSHATIASLATEPYTSTHFARQELNAMNTALLSKPIVATLGVSGIVAAVLTAQVAFSQGDTRDAAGPFALDAATSNHASDEAAPATLATGGSDSDPFGQANRHSPSTTQAADPFKIAPSVQRPPQTIQQPSRATDVDTLAMPSIVDLKPRSASEIAIETALLKPLNSLGLEFHDAPLAEVVDFLHSEYAIEIQLDETSLDELGLSPDDPVTINLRNINLESALNLMLRPLDLTYTLDNEVLLITSEEDALVRLKTRVYPALKIKVDFLQEVVAPESWASNGGFGTMASVGDKLVIRQTYAVHRQINELLSQLTQPPVEGSSRAPRWDAELRVPDTLQPAARSSP